MVLYSPAGGVKYRMKQHARFEAHLAHVADKGLDGVAALAAATDAGFSEDGRVGPWVTVLRRDPEFSGALRRVGPRSIPDDRCRNVPIALRSRHGSRAGAGRSTGIGDSGADRAWARTARTRRRRRAICRSACRPTSTGTSLSPHGRPRTRPRGSSISLRHSPFETCRAVRPMWVRITAVAFSTSPFLTAITNWRCSRLPRIPISGWSFLDMAHRAKRGSMKRLGEHRDRGIVAGLGDSRMKLRRQLHRIRAAVEGRVTAIADLEQVGDVLFGRSVAHQRDDAELEDLARFGDLNVGQVRHRQQVDDAFADSCARRRRHKSSAAGADLDGHHAVGFETAQRLAHRHPADAEPFAEFPLRRQPVAWLQGTVADQQPDLINDHLRSATRVHATEHVVCRSSGRSTVCCHGPMIMPPDLRMWTFICRVSYPPTLMPVGRRIGPNRRILRFRACSRLRTASSTHWWRIGTLSVLNRSPSELKGRPMAVTDR